MVDTSIMVFAVLMAVAFIVIILGFITRKSVIAMMGSLIMIIMAVALSGFVTGTESVYVDAIVENVTTMENVTETTYHYNYEAQSGTSALNAGGNVGMAVFASTGSSVLVGDEINCMDWYLKKTASPTGTMSVGILNSTNGITKLFGTKDVATLTTSNIWYTFCLSAGDSHIIASGDRMGLKYSGGDGSNSVGWNRDTAGTFDGTVTFQQVYTSSWASGTGTDSSARFYFTETTEEEVITPTIIQEAQWLDHEIIEPVDITTKVILAFLGIIFFATSMITFRGFTI